MQELRRAARGLPEVRVGRRSCRPALGGGVGGWWWVGGEGGEIQKDDQEQTYAPVPGSMCIRVIIEIGSWTEKMPFSDTSCFEVLVYFEFLFPGTACRSLPETVLRSSVRSSPRRAPRLRFPMDARLALFGRAAR